VKSPQTTPPLRGWNGWGRACDGILGLTPQATRHGPAGAKSFSEPPGEMATPPLRGWNGWGRACDGILGLTPQATRHGPAGAKAFGRTAGAKSFAE